ncbi:unnamed protein product [Peniophora sp. CBMAI 1063]|nr:unnamed protein product [Peniophora sp. CBMAI 1063]
MANPPRGSTSTLFKFSSTSLTSCDILDARSAEVKYRLRPGRTPDTVRIDHGGFIGLKSTCVNRLSSILYDERDRELGRVSWDAEGRGVRLWLTGGEYGRAGMVLPRLCGEDGTAEAEPRISAGWELQTSLRATWRAHIEGAAMFSSENAERMLALLSPEMVRGSDGVMTRADVARGIMGHSYLRMWVAPVDVVETLLTVVVAEASRRFVFDLGSLEPTPARASKARRPSIVGRFSGLMRRSTSDSSDSGLSSSGTSSRS